MKLIKQDLGIVMLIGILVAISMDQVLAQSGIAAPMATMNTQRQSIDVFINLLRPIDKLSYFCGLAFVALGFLKWKAYSSNKTSQTQTPIKTPLTLWSISAVLVIVPVLLTI